MPGKFVGGLRLPGDETGDCHIFTQKPGRAGGGAGVEFRYGMKIAGLETEGGRVGRRATPQGGLTADAYVVAMGSYSPLPAAPLGIDVPVYPVKGYSMTVPITDPAAPAQSTVMDETYKVAITRLGDRIRVGGTAELAGFSLRAARDRGGRRWSIRSATCSRAAATSAAAVLDRAAADDAGRHAGDRPDALPEPLPEHRSRHAWLDDGLRLRSAARGPDLGPAAGHRHADLADQPLRRPRRVAGQVSVQQERIHEHHSN